MLAIPDELLQQILLPAFSEKMQAWLQGQPQPDPQYTIQQAAEILNVAEKFVRAYMDLPAADPRCLPWVPVTDTPKGRRILLSDLTAWQQRNRRTVEPKRAEAPTTNRLPRRPERPARRRANPS